MPAERIEQSRGNEVNNVSERFSFSSIMENLPSLQDFLNRQTDTCSSKILPNLTIVDKCVSNSVINADKIEKTPNQNQTMKPEKPATDFDKPIQKPILKPGKPSNVKPGDCPQMPLDCKPTVDCLPEKPVKPVPEKPVRDPHKPIRNEQDKPSKATTPADTSLESAAPKLR
jgi:hypothetical protein